MNRIILITGPTSGIGKELTRKLLQNPRNHVIMASRNSKKSKSTVESFNLGSDNGTVSQVELNLSNLASIENCINEIKTNPIVLRNGSKIDIIVNNAGVFATGCNEPMTTDDGFELHMGTNYLGHFRLTLGLLDILKKNHKIISVGSALYKKSTLEKSTLAQNFDSEFMLPGNHSDPEFIPDYSAIHAYANSKHAILLFANKLRMDGYNAYTVSPGMVYTDISRFSTEKSSLNKFGWWLFSKIAIRTVEQGIVTLEYVIENDNLINGGYYSNGTFKPVEVTGELLDLDEELTLDLYEKSLKMANLVSE